ncbi:unnamed protein product [Cunninghamella blakesleeana]
MSIKGFFGLTITPGKVYSQIAESSFRLTMASIGDITKNGARTSLRIKVDDREFCLCSLTPGKLDQQLLDLIIVKGEEVALSITGENTIHLTGNYLHEYDEEDEEDDEEYNSDELDSDELDIPIEDEEDEDEDELDIPAGIDKAKVLAYLNGEIDSDEMQSDSEEEIDAARIEEIEEEEEEKPTKKLSKKEQKKQKRAAEEQAEEHAPKKTKVEQKKADEKKPKAEEKKPKVDEKKPAKQEQKKVNKLPNGLIVEDVKVGDGQNVRNGARIGMRYIGKLTNGKVFDKNTSGKPFSFRLGAGEVIKGWDQGILGMKLGGERKLTIPAPLAYGKRGAPPQIPPNATLVFEIKLVSMK